MIKFPSWRYHHTCPDGQIFNSEDEIPEGWVESPADINSNNDDGDRNDSPVKKCSAPNCNSAAAVRGMCNKHYARWYRETKSKRVMSNDDGN